MDIFSRLEGLTEAAAHSWELVDVSEVRPKVPKWGEGTISQRYVS